MINLHFPTLHPILTVFLALGSLITIEKKLAKVDTS